jgi:hypothetical protein
MEWGQDRVRLEEFQTMVKICSRWRWSNKAFRTPYNSLIRRTSITFHWQVAPHHHLRILRNQEMVR